MNSKILIIDDEEGLGQELSHILESEGYDVLVASNGDQARQIITQIPLDLVLLDLKLPDINGLDLVESIKIHGDAYIIVITAYGSLESAVRAVREKVYDYVTKPLDPEVLLVKIREALTQQAVERRLKEKAITLEKFQKLTTDRELQMIELKNKITQLEGRLAEGQLTEEKGGGPRPQVLQNL